MLLLAATLLLAAPGLRLTEMTIAPNHLNITAEPDSVSALCPKCHQISYRMHSHYSRTMADLPCGLRSVTFQLVVRRFFCDVTDCPRKVFCERLSDLAAAYARRTDRLHDQLQALAFDLGGEIGAKLAQRLRLGHPSPDTLLRLIRRAPVRAAPTPRFLGVDDWAMKKGRTYGTLLCDLEQHHVIDLLPDREATTLANWLQAHPGVEIITRDRSGAYAEGAKQGAPNAIQVADRFHLLQNLSGAIKQVIERNPAVLKLSAPEQPLLLPAPQPNTALMPAAPTVAPVSAAVQRRREWYERIQTLRHQGQPIRTIAQQLGVAINTVCKYVHLQEPPQPQRRSTLKMLSHEVFVQEQWNAGTRDPKTLFRLIQPRGFRGSYQTVARYVAQLRGPLPASQAVQAPMAPSPQLTVSQAVWALLLPSEKLTDEQKAHLAHLRQASEQVDQAYTLAHGFQDMVRQRRVDQLPEWFRQVELSGIPSLRGFSTSMKKDLAAVTAALSLPWSNGQVEGQVNRLKQIKRQMYGRGKLDLLKHRVLHYEASP